MARINMLNLLILRNGYFCRFPYTDQQSYITISVRSSIVKPSLTSFARDSKWGCRLNDLAVDGT